MVDAGPYSAAQLWGLQLHPSGRRGSREYANTPGVLGSTRGSRSWLFAYWHRSILTFSQLVHDQYCRAQSPPWPMGARRVRKCMKQADGHPCAGECRELKKCAPVTTLLQGSSLVMITEGRFFVFFFSKRSPKPHFYEKILDFIYFIFIF